jgi:hypothetical protein
MITLRQEGEWGQKYAMLPTNAYRHFREVGTEPEYSDLPTSDRALEFLEIRQDLCGELSLVYGHDFWRFNLALYSVR